MEEIRRYMDLVFYALSGKLTVGSRVVVRLDYANKSSRHYKFIRNLRNDALLA